MGARNISKYVGYAVVYFSSLLPISCSKNTAILREDIAENYRYFSFEDTDNNGKFDIVVIADSPDNNNSIRERIVGEAVVDGMYKILSQRRFKKITGQDYQESGLEKTVDPETTAPTPDN